MNDPDETLDDNRYDIRRIVKGLFFAYPNVKYIALNAGITGDGEGWTNEWYFSGFENKPVLKELDGYYTWVKDLSVTNTLKEEAIFFLHINSKDYYLDEEKLQVSKSEFIDESKLCFTMNENNEVIEFFEEDRVFGRKAGDDDDDLIQDILSDDLFIEMETDMIN